MKQKYSQEQIIGFKEFRLDADKYIKAVDKGESFLIVKRSKPVFRIEPVGELWETIGDFANKSGRGISATKLLSALKK